MIKYFLLIITLANSIILANGLDQSQEVANPLDLLSQSSVSENCNDMSDTEPDDDDEIIDTQNEQLGVVLSQKRPLEKDQEDNNPKKKIKRFNKNWKHADRDAEYLVGNLYKCKHIGCKYATPNLGNLKAHKLTHTGEKPCKCDWEGCSYATAQKTNLKAHIQRKHLCLRPFKCPIDGCSYAAAEKATLKKHINSKIHKKPTANSAVINLLINAGKNKKN